MNHYTLDSWHSAKTTGGNRYWRATLTTADSHDPTFVEITKYPPLTFAGAVSHASRYGYSIHHPGGSHVSGIGARREVLQRIHDLVEFWATKGVTW